MRDAGYEWDFLSGPRSIEEALSSLLSHFETERYVFVGVEETSEVVAEVPDWQLVATSAVGHGWP